MTERLYYTDAHLTRFESDVAGCVPSGDRHAVTLSATAFYPTSGGQPHDVGTLGGRTVLDVVDDDAGAVVHLLDGPLAIGARVEGLVDWRRRFDHMQQHTGQHVLSAAFEAMCRARTESFHLGAAGATIDLDAVLPADSIAAAEDDANRVVWEDREVRVRFATADEAATMGLRKASERTGTLRLVEVDRYDLSACGGTHVRRTGGIGVIAVTGWEKFKGGTRVHFLCGHRALAQLRDWRDALAATARVLSVSAAELAPAIGRLQDENKGLGRTVRTLQSDLAGHLAQRLVAEARSEEGRVAVVHTLDGWDAAGLKAVAAAVAASPGGCAAVFSATQPALVVVARAAGVPVDASVVLKGLIARFGGKGGGKPDLAQGGGLAGDPADLLAEARALLLG
ncbi:MAG: DHHA1 domain-containing protein [Vicinamibacterales bacterium]